jgi:hypothetical protein
METAVTIPPSKEPLGIWHAWEMSEGVAIAAWVLFGLSILAILFLSVRYRENRDAGDRNTSEEGSRWKLFIPRRERRLWLTWVGAGVWGLSAAVWFTGGKFWIAVPNTALCLFCLVEGIWGRQPEDRASSSSVPDSN